MAIVRALIHRNEVIIFGGLEVEIMSLAAGVPLPLAPSARFHYPTPAKFNYPQHRLPRPPLTVSLSPQLAHIRAGQSLHIFCCTIWQSDHIRLFEELWYSSNSTTVKASTSLSFAGLSTEYLHPIRSACTNSSFSACRKT